MDNQIQDNVLGIIMDEESNDLFEKVLDELIADKSRNRIYRRFPDLR